MKTGATHETIETQNAYVLQMHSTINIQDYIY